MKKLLFVSLYNEKIHVHFDASMLIMYLSLYPDAEFLFFGNKKHLDAVLQLVPMSHKVKKIPCRSNLAISISFLYFIKTFFLRGAYRVDLCGLFTSPLYFLVGLSQNECILHVPWWHNKRRLRYISGFFNFYLVNFFNQNLRIMNLGKWVFESYMRNLSIPKVFKNKFFWITHPFLINKASVSLLHNSEPVFGFFGLQNRPHKGTNDADHIKSFIRGLSGNVFGGEKFISVESFYPKVDYVVLSYLQNYHYLCSGVFIESIAYGKTIICFKNPICDYFFEKYGPICYAVSSMQELESLLTLLIHSGIKNNKIFTENLEKASADLTNPAFITDLYARNIIQQD